MTDQMMPIAFIVDDPPVNAAYYLRKQLSDRGLFKPGKGSFARFLDRWAEMEKGKIIPNPFWKKFIDWAQREGVKGKFTFLPCPAGLGCIDDKVEGYSQEELTELVGLVREEYVENFDITPEIFTHTLAWDVKNRQLLPVSEFEWMADKDQETLSSYMAEALKVLKNVGITATGITQPCVFRGDEDLYARAVLQAIQEVNGLRHTFYFLHADGLSERVPSRIAVARKDRDEYVVSVVSGVRPDEPFWDSLYGEGDVNAMADYFISEDGKSGRFLDLLDAESPIVFHGHSQTLYSNCTEKGFLALKEVVDRVNRHLCDRVQWMRMSEFVEFTISRADDSG